MAANEREPQLMVVCGRTGVGKTYTTIKMIDSYVKGNPTKGIKPRKVLILDPNQEFTQYKVIECTREAIVQFNKQPQIEARRITVLKNGGVKSMEELRDNMFTIIEFFRGGMFLLEDISSMVGDAIDTKLIGALCTLRHKDCDVVIHYQGIGKAGHPKIKMNTKILRMHWCDDTVERHKDKFDEKTELLKIAEAILTNRRAYGNEMIREIKRKNPNWKKDSSDKINEIFNAFMRLYVYVDYNQNTINGSFKEAEFRGAIFSYISENPEVLRAYNNKIDRTGKKLYSTQTAIQKVEDDLFDKYYGN